MAQIPRKPTHVPNPQRAANLFGQLQEFSKFASAAAPTTPDGQRGSLASRLRALPQRIAQRLKRST